MEGGRTLELFELEYSDLMLLSSSDQPLLIPSEEIKRLESISSTVMENLGPSGPGLLAITGVPKASILRRTLLLMAPKLALLKNEDRKLLFKDHGLGSDVPLKNMDRIVSAFAMQLKYDQDSGISSICNNDELGSEGCNSNPEGLGEFKNLGNAFKELGNCMMEVGLRLARVCDRNIGGHELEQGLLESCSAKGRLIHYHSLQDNIILKASNGKRFKSKSSEMKTPSRNQSNLWQQWHYDYGVFTVLTAPMFMFHCQADFSCQSFDKEECPPPSGHAYLQIFDPNKNSISMVKASSESFIVQVGESADILSKGKLRATLHSVCRPENLENLSRETFVVFLQPTWNKTLPICDFRTEHLTSNGENSGGHSEDYSCQKLSEVIGKIVPPLCDRLKDGMTFAEFSRETTKQYYGGSGLQSKR